MGVGYDLVNVTRREKVIFHHLPVYKDYEIIGNPVAGTLVTYYLFRCLGDQIAFVSDTYDDWPFATGSRADLKDYTEVTDLIVDEMVYFGWFDEGERVVIDPDEPELYYRSLTLGWNTDRSQFGLPVPPWGLDGRPAVSRAGFKRKD